MVRDEEENIAPLPRTPVSIRLGALEPEVARRRRGEEGVGNTIRRDLGRYYAAVRATVQRLVLDPFDATILVDSRAHDHLDANSARFLWAVVDEYINRAPARFPEGSEDYQRGKSLVEQLRALSPLEGLALLDGIEIYWQTFFHDGDRDDAMDASGLVHEWK
jgi:hypothetical protein